MRLSHRNKKPQQKNGLVWISYPQQLKRLEKLNQKITVRDFHRKSDIFLTFRKDIFSQSVLVWAPTKPLYYFFHLPQETFYPVPKLYHLFYFHHLS